MSATASPLPLRMWTGCWGSSRGSQSPAGSDAEIDALVAERTAARRSRDFARADEIRTELTERGIVLEEHSATALCGTGQG